MKEVKRTCATCKTKRPIAEMVQPSGSFRYACSQAISQGCAGRLLLSLIEKKRVKEAKEKKKAYNQRTKELKLKIEGRLDLYTKLGKLVNQYAKHAVYKGKHCYTCGKQQCATDNPGAFHAGPYVPAKRVDPRRFMIENIRIQCYSCNCKLSGNLAEYKKRLASEIGQENLEWLELEANHKPLKEQFPSLDDIRDEIARYRKLLRQHGINPAV